MKFNFQPHYLYPLDLGHAHHDGYSILKAKTKEGRFMLGGAKYEVMPGKDDDIARFSNLISLAEFFQ